MTKLNFEFLNIIGIVENPDNTFFQPDSLELPKKQEQIKKTPKKIKKNSFEFELYKNVCFCERSDRVNISCWFFQVTIIDV